MTPLLLALSCLVPAWGQVPGVEDVWDTPPSQIEPSPWDSQPASTSDEVASPWMEPSAWDTPSPSPRALPTPPFLDLAPWWVRPEPSPWTSIAPTASTPAEPGWEDASDEAGWGDDEAGFADSDDAGWGDDTDAMGFGAAPAPATTSPTRTPWFTFGGAIETRESLWLERLKSHPVASAKQSIDLEARFKKGIFRGRAAAHAEVDLAYWFPKDRWDEQTFRTYGYQVLPRELWISAAPAGPFEFSAGRKTVAWGEGLLLSPVDVIAPKDLREPGLADLEDLRLPVTMVTAGWYPGAHRFELYWVPEFDHGFRSPAQGPYGGINALVEQAPEVSPSDLFDDPTGGLLGDLLDAILGEQFNDQVRDLLVSKHYVYDHNQPRWKASQTQAFGRWKYSGSGVDLALYGGTLLDKQGVFVFPDLQTFLEDDEIPLELDHLRYAMLGHSGTAPVDKLLLRWELALDLNKPYNGAKLDVTPPDFRLVRGDLATAMIGVNVGYIPNTTVDVEVSQGVFLRNPGDLIAPADTTTWAMRVGWTGMRERLRLSGTTLAFGTDGRYGSLARADASYQLRDGLWATLGGIAYKPGRENGPLIGLDGHEQLFGQMRWSF